MTTFLGTKSGTGGALVALICLGVGVQFVACGSDVEESPNTATQSTSSGAGGAGNNGGGPPTTTSPSSASTGGGGPMTSASSGPGDACEMACEKATDCGFDFCSQLPIPLDCGFAQAECAAGCINDADCTAILTLQNGIGNADPVLGGCIQGCLGQGQGGAGGGPQDCQTCGQNNCIGDVLPCFNDAECSDWLTCIQGCMDLSCPPMCDAQFPNAAPLYNPIYACLCTNCDVPCAAADPCKTGTGGGGGSGQGGGSMGGGGPGGNGMGGSGQGGSGGN